MKSLVLIIPPSPWLISDRDIPMLGPLYLSSYLKSHGCQVTICDLSSLKKDDWYIPIGDVYGVTGVSPQFIYMREIIEKLKSREPHKTVIVGGVHATVFPSHVLDNTKADVCVVGEGEQVLFDFLSNPCEYHKSVISGVQFTSLDDNPFPDRDSIDYYSYLKCRTFGYMDLSIRREGSIITGRGCPYRCAFCASHTIHNGIVRLNSPEDVVSELIFMRDSYGVEMVNFLDDTFILDSKRVSDVCDLMKVQKLNIKWFCLTRADKTNEELLLKMKSVGCLSLAIGFESGSDRILRLMNKKITVEGMKEGIKRASSSGLMINGQLIVGFPTETDEDIELTAKFIRETPEVDTYGLHVFQPYPGTDVWNNPERYGIEIDKNTDFSNYHTIGKHDGLYSLDPVVDSRYRYLKDILGDRSREKRIS